jgi:hypothetical protein
MSLVSLSPIFIVSHGDSVFGVEHSASLEEKIAQTESGTGPTPVKLNDNARVSRRRIYYLNLTHDGSVAPNAPLSPCLRAWSPVLQLLSRLRYPV